MEELKGIVAVLITPFGEDGEVDYEGLKKNVNWLVEQGVHAILANGGTGEYQSLTKDERYKIAECVIEVVDGRVPVAIGTTHETQRKTIEYTKHAKSIGAAAVMISQPPYFKPNEEQIYHYFKDISDAVDIPIILYNNPWTTGVDVSEQLLIKMFEDFKNLVYLKDSTGGVQRARDVQAYGPEGTKILCGWEDLAYESFVLGAQGWISVAANVVPDLCIDLYNKTVIEKDFIEGRKVYDKLMPVLRYLENCGKLCESTKYMADLLGLVGGTMRGPRLPLDPEDKQEIRELLTNMGYTIKAE